MVIAAASDGLATLHDRRGRTKIFQSTGFTPQAAFLMTIWPRSGRGKGALSTCKGNPWRMRYAAWLLILRYHSVILVGVSYCASTTGPQQSDTSVQEMRRRECMYERLALPASISKQSAMHCDLVDSWLDHDVTSVSPHCRNITCKLDGPRMKYRVQQEVV